MLNHPLSASYFEVVNKYLSGTLLLNNGGNYNYLGGEHRFYRRLPGIIVSNAGCQTHVGGGFCYAFKYQMITKSQRPC